MNFANMYFANLTDFLQMGGHAPYVWSAYGIGGVILFLNIILPWWQSRRFREQLRRQLSRKAQYVSSASKNITGNNMASKSAPSTRQAGSDHVSTTRP